MLSIPKQPHRSLHTKELRSLESIRHEQAQNSRLLALGIDPYEYDTEVEYTKEEQDIINEAIKLIVLDRDLPEELEKKVKMITKEQTQH